MLTNLNSKIDRKRSSHKKTFSRLIIFLILLSLFTFVPLLFIYSGGKELAVHGRALANAYQNQNFNLIQKEVSSTKGSLQKVDFSMNFLFWVRILPFIGGYYADAKAFSSAGVDELTAVDKVLKDIEPSKAELGFNNQPIPNQDRIVQATKVLDKALPNINKVDKNLQSAAKKVENIDINKYPDEFRGIKVKQLVQTLKNFIIGAEVAVTEGKDALQMAPAALGLPTQKSYLLLFQNDKEIRPTGGFLTAFATLKIDKGQISTTTSDDIYRLDERLLEVCKNKICPLTPPAPIVKYLPEVSGKPRSAWSMRDSNLSPDVPTSAKEFEKMYQLLGEGLPFDGVIYIDAQVVEEMIEVTGPIEVFGTTYSAETDKRCDCPNVIYELERYAEVIEKGEADRKAILGTLMQQILARALGADVEKLPILLETMARLANHKHVMFYMHDQNLQSALSKLNWTGEIRSFDGDYLHINDSNFAGGKSNLYVNQTVTQEINIDKGQVKKKLTIEYKNSQAFSTWLNGINRDYVRIYVPKGSKLISSKGSNDPVNTIEDLDKTVFEAFITVNPQNSRILSFEYTVPYQPSKEYKILIQKQPGAKDFGYKIKLNGRQVEDFDLTEDREFKFSL